MESYERAKIYLQQGRGNYIYDNIRDVYGKFIRYQYIYCFIFVVVVVVVFLLFQSTYFNCFGKILHTKLIKITAIFLNGVNVNGPTMKKILYFIDSY